MSLSQPKITNPCKKFIEFKADSGIFRHWNKEEKLNVELKFPIKFIVLDELSTIKGYCEQFNCGIYSNEVHNLNTQVLHVKTFKGNTNISGMYGEIKAQYKEIGGKFCKSVYAALIHGENLELVNFGFMGGAFKTWIDKTFDISTHGVQVSSCSHMKKGKIEYQVPNFEPVEIPRGLFDKALLMDKMLQEYFKAYEIISPVNEAVQPDAKEAEVEDPF